MNVRRWSLAASILLAFSAAAAGQTTAKIEGVVAGLSGAPLADVRVEATSSSLPGARSAISDADGRYRLLALPPGRYRVRATLAEFAEVERFVSVSADGTAALDLTLAPLVREAVSVAADLLLVDVTSTTSGMKYTSDVIAKLPVGRNWADILKASPGTNTVGAGAQGRSPGLTVYGATSAENLWLIDGVDTTNVMFGTGGKSILVESVEEVELKSSGYPAEYGRAMGGIINALTKSGGNAFHGDAFSYWDPKNGTAKPATSEVSDVGFNVVPRRTLDYGADLGGFLVKDRLWFFGSYDRVDQPSDVFLTYATAAIPLGTRFPRDSRDELYSGKLTGNLDSRTSIVASAFSDPSEVEGAARPGTAIIVNPDPGTWRSRREVGGLDLSLRASRILSSAGLVSAQGSRHQTRSELFGSQEGAGVRTSDYTCSGGAPDRPCSVPVRPNWVTGGLGNIGAGNRNHAESGQFRLDGTLYSGAHEIRGGAEYDNASSFTVRAYTGGQLVNVFNEYGRTYYEHRFFAKSRTDLTPSDDINEAHSSEIALYVQDTWRPAANWTVNVGLRWDEQRARNHLGETVLNTTGQWQPRLGVVWDPSGRRDFKIYASAGRFSYAIPTSLTIFDYPGTTFVSSYNFDPVDRAQDPTVLGHEREWSVFGGWNEPVDSALKGSYQDELTVGVEKLLGPTFTVALKGTYRRLGRVIAERCDLDYTAPENKEFSCAIINPGSDGRYARGDFPACNGLDGESYACSYGAPAAGPARRLYRGVELVARKTIRDRLWLQASYVYSSLRGNVEAPSGAADYDYPQFLTNGYGRLSLDRPHAFRLDASYTTPFRLFVGLQGWVQSGAPADKIGYFNANWGSTIRLVPRGSAKRLPTLWEGNLTVGFPIRVGPADVTLQAYVYNLFNNQLETEEDVVYTTNAPPGYPETMFDPNVPQTNPYYGRVYARQEPRRVRFAAKIAF